MIKPNKNTLFHIEILLLSAANLFVMHGSIVKYSEVPLDMTSYVDNIIGVVIDLMSLILLLLLCFKRRINKALICCYFITLMWAFSNILYSRFFFQYISLSAISQTSNLFDLFMIRCIIEGFQWQDALYCISLFAAIGVYYHMPPIRLATKKILKATGLTLSLSFILCITATIAYSLPNSNMRSLGFIKHHLYTHHFDLYRNSANPNWTHFHRGSLRTILQPALNNLFVSKELKPEQKHIIEKEINNQNSRITSNIKPDIENIIFIIVESYLSITSDLVVRDKEITPYLNKLKKENNVYYNGNLKSNITIGESGDGQFIFMTGLLPLRSEITIGQAKKCKLYGLPKIMSEKMGLSTRMLIPTTPSMWEQEQMCQQYGIEKLYSCNDFNKNGDNLNDQQIFNALKTLDNVSPRPFFSLVLTMSMHQPYTKKVDPSFTVFDANLSNEYLNYLNACHYTDKQIGMYLQHLKENNLYYNSLIIITADHNPNPNSLKQENLSYDIPLYIINANINESAWSGKCNQLDVYPTILDILIQEHLEWRGLGHTLLSPNYKNSITPNKWNISEWILNSDYFSSTNDIK